MATYTLSRVTKQTFHRASPGGLSNTNRTLPAPAKDSANRSDVRLTSSS